ncbi:helix-turn-helix domain-containing protein [Vibrio salilacus]|uniref:helix-turn-helix domain-containing protein n=1 Tax=Vibrio salilacus TaxID=1323749 RepID=UPI000C29CF76|nr:helix-turn-helix domain-containing protein [Vibrio salilacus]
MYIAESNYGVIYGPVNLVELIEKNTIIHALKHHQGHLQQTAKALGVGRTTLWRKIRKYDIDETAIVESS